jgi:hypothetical protein
LRYDHVVGLDVKSRRVHTAPADASGANGARDALEVRVDVGETGLVAQVPKKNETGVVEWESISLPSSGTASVPLADPATADKLGVWVTSTKATPAIVARGSPPVANEAPSSWFPCESPDASRRRGFARQLRTAKIVGRENNVAGKGSANETTILVLELDDGRRVRALMKNPEGERGVLAGHRLGELFMNEVNASRVAAQLGIEVLVSHSIDRNVDGRTVALQPWHDDTIRADAPPGEMRFDRGLAEIVRAFDYVVGNPDRQGRNMLVVPTPFGNLPLGIDYGLAFPRGPMIGGHSYPAAWVEGQSGPLLSSTIDFIRGIDARSLAQLLAQIHVPASAAEHTLRRLERLKRDASFLTIDGPTLDDAKAMSNKVSAVAPLADQGLDAPALASINAMVAEAYAPNARSLVEDGALIRESETGKVFLVKDGKRWHVPNPQVFAQMGLDWAKVRAADLKLLDAVPEVSSL